MLILAVWLVMTEHEEMPLNPEAEMERAIGAITGNLNKLAVRSVFPKSLLARSY